MTIVRIDLQKVSKGKYHRPHKREVDKWFLQLHQCLVAQPSTPARFVNKEEYSLTVRMVDEEESLMLNSKFRSINHATNVLSFPFDSPVDETDSYIGDLVMCGVVIEREAREFGMEAKEYWAKLFIHGCLHLFGYTHENDADHAVMEAVADKWQQLATAELAG